MLYPDRGRVSEDTVISWAQDAWDDLEEKGPEEERPVDIEMAKELLEDLGLCTFAGARK